MEDEPLDGKGPILSIEERFIVHAADECENFTEIVQRWTINSIDLFNWEAKRSYLPPLLTAATRLYDFGYIRVEQSWGGVMPASKGRAVLIALENWWTVEGDQGFDENGTYFLSLTESGRQLKPRAHFSWAELPLGPPTR